MRASILIPFSLAAMLSAILVVQAAPLPDSGDTAGPDTGIMEDPGDTGLVDDSGLVADSGAVDTASPDSGDAADDPDDVDTAAYYSAAGLAGESGGCGCAAAAGPGAVGLGLPLALLGVVWRRRSYSFRRR